MMKNILIIGGSMFTGRVFSIQASRNGGFNLYVVNRGNHPMELERVMQYKCDRHDTQNIAKLVPDIHYDALIDFCAYNPGEIAPVIDALGGRIKQYVFFSTASVYTQGAGFLDEDAPLCDISESGPDTVINYIRSKIILEHELADACDKAGLRYTILRPTFIYGPFNYAPRESYFIEMIAKKDVVPVPVPIAGHSRFNFVYVLDIASALMSCIGDGRAYDAAFNLAGDEAITYPGLIAAFERFNKEPLRTREVTLEQIDTEKLPLPFPLAGDTLVDGGRFSRTFDFKYTPFLEGMEKTFKIFYSLYTT